DVRQSADEGDIQRIPGQLIVRGTDRQLARQSEAGPDELCNELVEREQARCQERDEPERRRIGAGFLSTGMARRGATTHDAHDAPGSAEVTARPDTPSRDVRQSGEARCGWEGKVHRGTLPR